MSREDKNKAIIGRWFTKFWGETCDLGIVDELAAPPDGLREGHVAAEHVRFGGRAGRDHDPDHPRRGEPLEKS